MSKKMSKIFETRPISGICVDGSSLGSPGKIEYRGVDLETGVELFRFGHPVGTNNIAEFLAIVEGLRIASKTKQKVYSDSKVAIFWVKIKKCRTWLLDTIGAAPARSAFWDAEKWLRENDHEAPIFWSKKKWGEIPADFGQK